MESDLSAPGVVVSDAASMVSIAALPPLPSLPDHHSTVAAALPPPEKPISVAPSLQSAAFASPITAIAIPPADELSFPTAPPAVPTDDDPSVWANARRVYWNYFFAAWGARMWEFAAIVFIMDGLFPSSLMASSLFGLFEALAGIFGSGPAGHLIDTRGRLAVIRLAIMIQNTSVVVAMAVLCTAMLAGGPSLSFGIRALVLAVIVILGVTARFGAMLDKMCVNKDWLVVIASGNRNVQSQINASVRRIDMVCQILAPMGVGLGSSYLGPSSTCVLVGGWAFFSVFIEFRLAGIVYAAIPALAQPKPNAAAKNNAAQQQQEQLSLAARVAAWLATTRDAFAAYSQHQCLWISIPFCMLYVSVLSFGGIMVSYLKTLGCSDDLLSAGRGLAALVAIGPTFAVPYLIPKKGLYRTAKWMLWAQIVCLIPIVVGFILGLQRKGVETIEVTVFDQVTQKYVSRVTSTMPVAFIVLVFISICSSRFGLWGFDLAQTQMMQELVDKSEVGKVNGAQELMLNGCWLLSFALTMVFSAPEQFMWPTYVSFAMVLGAGIAYTTRGMRIEAAVKESTSS